MPNILFICGKNKLRSPTAERVFASYTNLETDSAGINHDALVRVATEQLAWADWIVVMERTHQKKLSRQFKSTLSGKRVICLDIPDNYAYMAPELVTLLEKKMTPLLRSMMNVSNAR